LLVAKVIEWWYLQVIPLPKPRGKGMTSAEQHKAGRAQRRADAKVAKEKEKVEERKRKLEDLKAKEDAEHQQRGIGKEKSIRFGVKSSKSSDQSSPEAAESKSDTTNIKCYGEEAKSDLGAGTEFAENATNSKCIWDQPITYELQVRAINLRLLVALIIDGVMCRWNFCWRCRE
jgi:hypothetical protein